MKVQIINTYHSKIYNCVGKLTVTYNLLITYKVIYDNGTIMNGELTTKVNNKPDSINEIERIAKGIILHHININ